MERDCPRCGAKMDVFDEACPTCGGESKPGKMLSVVAVVHGYRSVIFLAACLTAGWFVLSWLFKW